MDEHNMKRRALSAVSGVFIGVALASSGASASRLEPKWSPIHAMVSVGPDGRVTDVTVLEGKLSPAIKSIVVARVKGWHYAPVLVNGVAAPATTYANFDACAMPSGDGYNLAVTYTGNGPLFRGALPLDFSPTVAEYSDDHQDVVIKLRVTTDGHAQLQDVVMTHVNPNVQHEVRATIADWIRSMRFQPEQIGGQAVATDMEWPMELTKRPFERFSGSHEKNFDPETDIACKSARSTSAGNTPRAIDSRLKLQEDVRQPEPNAPAQ